MKVRAERLREMRDYEMKKMLWYIHRLIGEERMRPDDWAQPGSGYRRTFDRDGTGKVTMVRSEDGFRSFDLGKAYSEPNTTRREFAELTIRC